MIFQNYLKNHFIKHVPDVGDENIVIFDDGHKSHVCVSLIECANESICPVPHTLHL